MAGIADKVDKAYEGKSPEEPLKAPAAALQGVSESDAEHLKAAFGIDTIGELGTNKFFRWAQAIVALAD
jgi:demethoxyubiquinone hydroxylase (CLK1/Coq7/Cat5 family)